MAHHLPTNLRTLRTYMGYSQQWVADSIHASRSQYSGWEQAAAEPGISMLIALSIYFNVSLEVLLLIDLAPMNGFDLQRTIKSHRALITSPSPLAAPRP